MKTIYFKLTFLLLNIVQLNAQTFTTFVTDLDDEVTGIEVEGNYLYFTSFDEGNLIDAFDDVYKISKIDLTEDTPYISELLTSITIQISSFGIHENYLYYQYYTDIFKIDLTENSPTGDLFMPNTAIDRMAFNGGELYFTSYNKIAKININETEPTVIDVATELEFPSALVFKENDLYFSNQNEISKIDITENTTIPEYVSDVANSKGLAFANDILCISDASLSKIYGLDINETGNTSVLYDDEGILFIKDIAVFNDDLYIIASSDNKIFKISNISSQLSVNDNSLTPSVFNIYPNPTSNKISISGIRNRESYIIYNVLGKVVLNGTISENEKIDIINLNNGVYFLKLTTGTTLKFIKN